MVKRNFLLYCVANNNRQVQLCSELQYFLPYKKILQPGYCVVNYNTIKEKEGQDSKRAEENRENFLQERKKGA